jgi:hypothetical protein
MFLLPLAVISAVINMLRGGGIRDIFPFKWNPFKGWPSRPGVYMGFILMALVSWLVTPWYWALAVGASYAVWAIPEWGRWYTLGREDRFESSGEPGLFGKAIELVDFGNDYIAFTLRNLVCLIPLSFVLGPFALLLAFGQTAAYEAGWRIRPKGGIAWAEALTGVLWGITIFFLGKAS